MTPKEILAKIKAVFTGEPAPGAAASPPATITPTTPKVCSYPVDGGAVVFVDISDDGIPDIDLLDKVYSDAALTTDYPDGVYKVTGTNFSFTVTGAAVSAVDDPDGTGPGAPLAEPNITAPVTNDVTAPAATAAAPGTAAPTGAAAMSTENLPKTPEELRALYLKFAAGTPEERIANLELVAKALMEYSFGWQIREAEQKQTADQAINIYKQGLTTTQATLAKHEKTIKDLFDLVEMLCKEPEADPKTITGNKKVQFDRMTKRDERLQRIGEALKKNKAIS